MEPPIFPHLFVFSLIFSFLSPTMRSALFLFLAAAVAPIAGAFAPASSVVTSTATRSGLAMTMDPASIVETVSSSSMMMMMTGPEHEYLSSSIASNPMLLAFSDQGQNLAGIFFQASLLPYLAFLYFLSFRGNRIPALGNFGFQFVLIFVAATIPSGIISRAAYETSLANVDWLHGGAEALLTVANICLVLGFKDGITNPTPASATPGRLVALGCAGLFAATCAYGPGLGFEVHSPFLLGLGDLSPDATISLPWVRIHFCWQHLLMSTLFFFFCNHAHFHV